MASLKNMVSAAGREVRDYLTGYPSTRRLKELEVRVRELSPERVPLTERKELLFLETQVNRTKGLATFNKYFQPAFTLWGLWGTYQYMQGTLSQEDFFGPTLVLAVFKGVIQVASHLHVSYSEKLNALALLDLQNEHDDEGEEWKRGTEYGFSGDF